MIGQQDQMAEGLDGPVTVLLGTRIAGGLIFGCVLGLTYGAASALIDNLVLRDVPLALDSTAVTTAILANGVGGLALGAVTAWPQEGWKGVLAGALAIAAFGLARTFWLSSAAALVFIPLLLPLVLIAAPIAAVVRLAAGWHTRVADLQGSRRLARWGMLLALAIGVAAFAGSWSQMPADAQAAVRQVDRAVRFLLDNPNQPLSVSFKDIAGLSSRLSRSYTLSERPASVSPTGVEVGVRFSTGFAITCVVDHRGAVPLCFAGSNLFGGPAGGEGGP